MVPQGVELLLGKGRKDESGDYTKGAELDPENRFLSSWTISAQLNKALVMWSQAAWKNCPMGTKMPKRALKSLAIIASLLSAAGYDDDRIRIDPSVIRGLEYYTGPVFEAEVTFDVKNDKGQVVQFGSVGGGGRYDGLVARFKGVEIPATGMSIGVSRLYTAMQHAWTSLDDQTTGPVLVLVMDKERIGDYQAMTQELRAANIRCEMYVGSSAMKAQMKYADKRTGPLRYHCRGQTS